MLSLSPDRGAVSFLPLEIIGDQFLGFAYLAESLHAESENEFSFQHTGKAWPEIRVALGFVEFLIGQR